MPDMEWEARLIKVKELASANGCDDLDEGEWRAFYNEGDTPEKAVWGVLSWRT